MNAKRLLIIAGVVVMILLAGGVYIWQSRRAFQQGETPEISSDNPQAPEELLTWEDPAGFSFQYPKGVEIDKHDEDQDNYAHVELTHKDHKGSIVLWVKDAPLGIEDAASWVKKEKAFRGANILDTTIGGQQGKKVLVSTPANKLYVGTVFDDLLWYVETTPQDSAYWDIAHETIINSYAFTPLEQPAAGGSVGGGDEEVDEEEVVE